MLANRTSRWSLGAAVLCLALVAASWFLLISPRRAEAVEIHQQTDQASAQAAQLRVQLAQLKVDFADLPKAEAELKAIRRQVPAQAQMPDLVRTLQRMAFRSGVSLDSITPAAPVLVPEPGQAPAAAGAGSLVSVPMALVVTGDYWEVSLFVKRLQTQMARSFLISSLTGTSAPETEPAPTSIPTTPLPPTTPTPTGTGTASPTPTPTPTPSASASMPTLDRMSLAINGSVFVLLTGTVTLDEVAKDLQDAARAGTTTAPTGSPTPAPGSSPTSAPGSSPTTAPTTAPATTP